MFAGVNTEETFSLKTIIKHTHTHLTTFKFNFRTEYFNYSQLQRFSRRFTKAKVQFTTYFSKELEKQAEKKGIF